jgi:hypothetical protein
MAIRCFTSRIEDSAGRSVDDDAPTGLRQEFLDLAFRVFGQVPRYNEIKLYQIIVQSSGFSTQGQPYGGFRHAADRDIGKADWRR